ncbi:MAG: YggU family protein [Candidatus Aenigmarchaeota archaeon]|nr:YggU family protein [Candidatus Aenigmarchaeota archaeon]
MDSYGFIASEDKNSVVMKVKIVPNSKKDLIVEVNEYVKIKISEKPVAGKANRRLIDFLEDLFGCKAELISGHKSRNKLVKIFCSKEKVLKKLKELGYV